MTLDEELNEKFGQHEWGKGFRNPDFYAIKAFVESYILSLMSDVKLEERKEAIYEHNGLILDNSMMQAGTLIGYNQALVDMEAKIFKELERRGI